MDMDHNFICGSKEFSEVTYSNSNIKFEEPLSSNKERLDLVCSHLILASSILYGISLTKEGDASSVLIEHTDMIDEVIILLERQSNDFYNKEK